MGIIRARGDDPLGIGEGRHTGGVGLSLGGAEELLWGAITGSSTNTKEEDPA